MLLYTFYVIIFLLIDTKSKQSVCSHLINSQNYYLLLFVQELRVIFEASVFNVMF